MLIAIIVITCIVGATFGRPSDEPQLSEIPTVIPENEEILASETTVEHVCSNYYVSKYDTKNHWNECSICGEKYDVKAHTYTETWTMGESCSPSNKCNHICSCGYSYQTGNTREHKNITNGTNMVFFRHYQICSDCGYTFLEQNCTKEDGSKISCDNIGTCSVCNKTYTQVKHRPKVKNNTNANEMMCMFCGKLVAIFSNITSKVTSNSIEFSYDLNVSEGGYFSGCSLSWYVDPAIRNKCTMEYHTKTENSPTSIHVTGKMVVTDPDERRYSVNSILNNYNFSANEVVSGAECVFTFTPDQEPPVINPNIVQTNLATSNGWATQKQLTVSGTENFCSAVKITLKDSDGNTYLNNAAAVVTDGAWSYTFVPDIEASETGKQFTITVTDNLGNSSEKTFTVEKTDKKAPTITSAGETSQTWTKTKPFTFTATDEGSGGVSIAINDANAYVSATKSGTTYSRAHTFTEEIYGSKNVTIYFKDALGNATSQNFKVYNIDSTKPTITKQEIVNNEIVLTGNDINTTLNKEGSGISKYRYLGSSEENVTVGETTGKETTSNKISLTEFEKVKYAYIAAIDKAGNISNTIKVVLPTYKVTVNPNGGTWRGINTNTELTGYNYKQTVAIENPTRQGYEFKGWTVSSGTIADTTYTFGLGNATLTAKWEAIEYTITVHHYIYDEEENKNTTVKLVEDEEIKGKLGEKYTSKPSNKITANYECINEQPEGYEGTIEETKEISYYYKLKATTIESSAGSKVKTKVEKDENGNYIIRAGKEIEYEVTYETKIKDYIGKATIEIEATLPKGTKIDQEKCNFAEGTYNETTNTINWVKEIEKIDTFAYTENTNPDDVGAGLASAHEEGEYVNGTYVLKIVKDITIVYAEDYILKDIGLDVKGKTITYYPDEYPEKGGQASTSGNGTIIIHHYIYDEEKNENTTLKLVPNEEIIGKIGTEYTSKPSSKITANYECINEQPEGSTGTITKETKEISYYYKLKTPKIESNTDTKIKTELEKDENGNYIIKAGKEIEYEVTYETKIKDYIGKATIEIKATLPKGTKIDEDKCDFDGGTYDETTNTINWTKEITDIDTFAHTENTNPDDVGAGLASARENGTYIDGTYVLEIVKEITIVYAEDYVLKDANLKVAGKTILYYPDDYPIEKDEPFIKDETKEPDEPEETEKGKIVVHHYIYDAEDNKYLDVKLAEDEEIEKEIGENYETKASNKIPANYTVVNEQPEGYKGTIEKETKEINYYYQLTKPKTEGKGSSTIKTELEKDENGNYIIKAGKEVEYEVEYELKIEDYIGKATIEIKAELPEGTKIDLNKSDLNGGTYDETTNTITWVKEIENINTYENGPYTEKITQDVKIVYAEDYILKDANLKITGNIITYYPEGYPEKGGQSLPNDNKNNNPGNNPDDNPEEKTGKVIVRYVDIESEEGAYEYEITGKIGEPYETQEKEIKYYVLVKTTENTKGEITEETQIVTYYYRKLDFNIGIEKTIDTITLNGQNVKISNKEIAKLELKKDEIKKSEIIVKYNIKVTNTGELGGTAKVQEILPSGYTLVGASFAGIPVRNDTTVPETTDWQENTNGTLETEIELEPGETKELDIVLRWENKEENLGAKTNKVKIEETKNTANFKDTNKEDNLGEATVIVNIKTGEIVSNLIIMIIVLSLGICTFISMAITNKRGIKIKDIKFLNK